MLHIVLFLLKIIGIILASILGLLLFLILVVLLVPIRYRINADNNNEIRAEAKISWLLRLFYIRIVYSDNQMIIKLRLFGKIFYDSSNLKEKKQPQKPGKKKKLRKSVKKSGTKTKIKTEKTVIVQNKVKPAEIVKIQKDISQTDIVDFKNETNLIKIDQIELNKTPVEANEVQKEIKAAEITESKDQIKVEYMDDFSEDFDNSGEDLRSKEHTGIFAGIKGFFYRIREFFIKIKNWFYGLKKRILNLKEKILTIGEKWDKIKAFLKDDDNKSALSKAFKTVKRILKHIRPTKLRLELEFGTGDPCSTGQALGVFAIFYGYYGKSMRVIPNFEEEILKGSIFCIGRIRLFTLLIICIKLILDKKFRNLLKNFKTLKEDL